MTEQEILNYARANGMIDYDTIREKIEMNERKKYLEKHQYSIWEGKDGIWRTHIREDDGSLPVRKRKTKKLLEDYLVEYYKKKENEPTIQKIFNEWVEQKLEYNEISRSTFGRYVRDFNKFFNLLDMKNRKISYINEDDVEHFIRKTIAENNLTAKAYSNVKTLIIGIFKYAKKKKWTKISISQVIGDLDLSSRVFANRVIYVEDEIFFQDEVEKIVDYIHKNPTLIRLGILLAFETGMRVGELSTLRKTDIGDHYIHVHTTETEYPDENGIYVISIKEYPKSGAGDRYIYINDQTMHTIEEIIKLNPDGDFLFEQQNRTRGFSRVYGRNFNPALERICKNLGMSKRTMHKIRKTYGTTLLDSNVDESIIIEQMGHADIACTKQYYYFSNKRAEQKLEQIKSAIEF